MRPDIYVSHIGINRINLGGKDVEKYGSLPNTELVSRSISYKGKERLVKTIVMYFENDNEMVNFLQEIIDLGIGFTDNNKSIVYSEACRLKSGGILKGEILGC